MHCDPGTGQVCCIREHLLVEQSCAAMREGSRYKVYRYIKTVQFIILGSCSRGRASSSRMLSKNTSLTLQVAGPPSSLRNWPPVVNRLGVGLQDQRHVVHCFMIVNRQWCRIGTKKTRPETAAHGVLNQHPCAKNCQVQTLRGAHIVLS